MIRSLTGMLTLCAVLSTAFAADPAPEEKTGLKVGDRAPAFALKDQAGKERTLAELTRNGPAALVFYRSASW